MPSEYLSWARVDSYTVTWSDTSPGLERRGSVVVRQTEVDGSYPNLVRFEYGGVAEIEVKEKKPTLGWVTSNFSEAVMCRVMVHKDGTPGILRSHLGDITMPSSTVQAASLSAETPTPGGSRKVDVRWEPGNTLDPIRRVRIWINAFIPRDVPGVTVTVPGKGTHAGKTMLPSTFWGDCFLTDQRTFSSSPAAKARIHSEFTVDLTGELEVTDVQHYCDQTTEVDCEDGDEEGTAVGSVDDVKFGAPQLPQSYWDKPGIVMPYSAAASNPLVAASAVAGEIDIRGAFQVVLSWNGASADVTFTGEVDDFPAFEAYVQVEPHPPVEIFTRMPDPGVTAVSLVGRPENFVKGTVHLGT